MRVLFLSAWYPLPADNGSKLRVSNLLRQIAAHHEVALASYRDPDTAADETALKEICSEVVTTTRPTFEPLRARALAALLSPTPRSLVDMHSAEMAAQISQLCRRFRPDVIVASQMMMASYAGAFGRVPAIFEEAEVGGPHEAMLNAGSSVARRRARLTWVKLARYLRRLLPRFAAVTVVSDPEANLLRAITPHPGIAVIPNGVDPSQYSPSADTESYRLIFSGSFRYGVNHDAVSWFLRYVFPLVRSGLPATHLMITGDRAGVDLPPLPGVVHAGHVDDVRGLVASSTVSIAPILTGGGTRLKVLEAMALGTPVVATSKALEGLRVIHGEHVLVADDPAIFATHVLRLLRDPLLRSRLTARARQLVETDYTWETIGARFEEILSAASASRG